MRITRLFAQIYGGYLCSTAECQGTADFMTSRELEEESMMQTMAQTILFVNEISH